MLESVLDLVFQSLLDLTRVPLMPDQLGQGRYARSDLQAKEKSSFTTCV